MDDIKKKAVLKGVDGNNRFAIDMYSKLSEEEGNIFFSPASIYTAMAMVYEGAAGATEEQIRGVMHYPVDSEERGAQFSDMMSRLNKDADYKVSVANGIWAAEDLELLGSYVSKMKSYGTEASTMDFKNDYENARKEINQWVEQKTNDKIKDLFPENSIHDETRMVLANAIYFKGDWKTQFKKDATSEREFGSPKGSVKAKMMGHGAKVELKYGESDGLQFLEIPYKGGELSMLFVLPEENGMEDLEKTLSAEKIEEWESKMYTTEVRAFIPKFKSKTSYKMADMLAEMGMPLAFSDYAEFPGIAKGPLKISSVFHKAFVDVNEEGTEAAAATGIAMVKCVSIERDTVFDANRPFIYMIKENDGNILFMGKMENPSE